MQARLTSIALFSIFMSACAPVQTSSKPTQTAALESRSCLFQDDVRNFRVSHDMRDVYVRGVDSTVYRLSIRGACRDLDTTLTIGFAPMGGINRVCTGDYTRLVVGKAPAETCNVSMAGALTEAEVDALPQSDRP